MSGLAAQKVCFPAEGSFLPGPFCHGMARSNMASNMASKMASSMTSSMAGKPCWSPQQQHALYFTMDRAPHVQQMAPTSPPALDKQKPRPCSQSPAPRVSRPPSSPPRPGKEGEEGGGLQGALPAFQRLSVYERGSKPLPPLPGRGAPSPDREADRECDDSCSLVRDQWDQWDRRPAARRSLRVCGLVNPAYLEGPAPSPGPAPRPPDPPRQRRLRRSHSGPAGSFQKRLALQPPPPPVPPRPAKPADPRRWSAEVLSSGACSEEPRPPRVPPREPLTLPAYAHGLMPPTQSFAPDPKYVSRGLRRQLSEGSPCILPLLEGGRQASSTHYLLLPAPPPLWDPPHVDLV